MISSTLNQPTRNVISESSLIRNHDKSISNSNFNGYDHNLSCLEEAESDYDRIRAEIDEILQQLESQNLATRNHLIESDPFNNHQQNPTPSHPTTPPSQVNLDNKPANTSIHYSTTPSSPPQDDQNTQPVAPQSSHIKTKDKDYKALAKNITKKIKKNQQYSYPSEKENLFIPHGSIINEEKNPNHTRFILQNICGITGENNSKLEDVITQFNTYNADYAGLTETRINPYSDFAHNSQTLVERRIPGALITHANTKKATTSDDAFQYGGVSTLMSKTMNKKLKDTLIDKYGRWIQQTFFIKDKLLQVYTAYRVCNTGEDHENSASEDQKHQLELDGISTSPRKHIIESLKKKLEHDLNTNSEIIVMADANESRLHSDTLFLDMMRDLGFTNVMEHFLGKQLPPTQNRSREAIDHVWISKGLLDSLVQACILPLFEFIIADHRAIVLDFNNHKLHSTTKLTLNHYTTSKVSSKNITSRDDYLMKLDEQLENQRVHRVFTKFHKNKQNLQHDEKIEFLNTRVKQLYEIMLGCENRCKHKYDGFFTPEMSLLWSTKHHLQKRIRTLKWQEIHRPQLFSLDELLELQNDLADMVQRIEELNSSAEETELHLDELRAKDLVKHNKFKTEETALKVVKNTRQQKLDSKKIKSVIHRHDRQNLSHITIPSKKEYHEEARNHYKNVDVIWNRIEVDQGEDVKDWEPVTLPVEVESMLYKWQQLHFSQAKTTPLGNKRWINLIDKASSFADIQKEAQTLKPTTRVLLEHLFPINDAEDTTYNITLEDFKSFIDSKKEETRTSPNGIHYGHLKSIRDHVILQYLFDLIELCIDLNYIPLIWRDTITTLAPKKSGVFHIHRLRPIHIVEPMIQFISHIFWSNKFMRECEDKGNITDSQYGGRRGRQAQNAVIKQVVLWDIARHQNKLMASHMADARANFDRNMSHIVARALIKKGLDPRIVKLYQTFLRSQLFYIRTALGISKKAYKYDPNKPFFGDGQGIGWSSVNQIIISTIIDEIFNELATSFKVTSADGVFDILTGVNFFIDDRISNTINHDGDIQQLLQDFQANETLQTYLLNDTGGAVAPKKCCWWLLERKPKDVGFGVRLKPSIEGSLSLQNSGDSKPYKIKLLPPNVAKKYLGCIISPDFSSKLQLQVLHNIIDTWCSKIRHSRLPPYLISKAYNENLVPKISYPLVVADITKEQADALMRKVRATISVKTRFRRTTALELTHGPYEFLGEQLTHIYDLSGREKVAFFMYHLRNSLTKDDTVYDVIMTSFLDHQLALGYMDNFLNLDYSLWGKLIPTRSWLISLWEFLSKHNTQVDMSRYAKYTPPRENDFFLMEEILCQERNTDHIRIFNKIRLHYELLTASDIVLEDGKRFYPDVLKHRKLSAVRSTYTWPNKEEYPKEWFDIFHQLLHTHIRQRINRKPLGSWTAESHQVHQALQTDDNNIWICGWTFVRSKGNRFKRTSQTPMPPDDTTRAVQVSVESAEAILLLSHQKCSFNPKEDDITDWRHELWGLIDLEEETLDEIAEHMCKPFILVTDGGCPEFLDCCIFSWVLADTDGTVFFKNGGGVGGFRRDHTSFRAEAYAALSGVSFINFMHNRYDGLSLDRQFFSDNLEVTKLEASVYINPRRKAASKRNFDVKTQLQHELACHIFPPNIQHVLGHQDDVKKWLDLTIPERLNCIADGFGHEIEAFFCAHPEKLPPPVSTFLPAQDVSLRTPLHRLVVSSPNEICIDTRIIKLLDYLQTRQHFTQEQIDCWDFNAFQSFNRNLNRTERSRYRNIIYRQWSTMKKLKLINYMENDICPLCNLFCEDEEHVLTCMSTTAVSTRNAATATAKHQMRSIHTPEGLINVFISCLRTGALVGPEFDEYRDTYPELETIINKTITDQETIGLEKIQAGFLAKRWANLMKEHFKSSNDDRLRPSAWMKKMISICLEYTSTLWNARCETTHNQESVPESTYRTNMTDLFSTLLEDSTSLGTCTSLLHRNTLYFQRKPITDLKLWEAKVRAAQKKKKELDQRNKKKTLLGHSFTVNEKPNPSRKPKRNRKPHESKHRLRKRKLRAKQHILKCSNIKAFLTVVRDPPIRQPPVIPPSPEPPDPT